VDKTPAGTSLGTPSRRATQVPTSAKYGSVMIAAACSAHDLTSDNPVARWAESIQCLNPDRTTNRMWSQLVTDFV